VSIPDVVFIEDEKGWAHAVRGDQCLGCGFNANKPHPWPWPEGAERGPLPRIEAVRAPHIEERLSKLEEDVARLSEMVDNLTFGLGG